MKWPNYIALVRHDVSAYNLMKEKKEADPEYQVFRREFERDHRSAECLHLAKIINERYTLDCSDCDTPLVREGKEAEMTGRKLKKLIALPYVIFVSPYARTRATLAHMIKGWPELGEVKIVPEERIREQEHGLSGLFNDWRVFQTFYPDQKLLYDREGKYWYRFPQGESAPDVRRRNHDMTDTLVRDYAMHNVLMVTHHLNILAQMANYERWDHLKFIEMDENQKPINCGVTLYRGDPNLGTQGKLVRDFYNQKLY